MQYQHVGCPVQNVGVAVFYTKYFQNTGQEEDTSVGLRVLLIQILQTLLWGMLKNIVYNDVPTTQGEKAHFGYMCKYKFRNNKNGNIIYLPYALKSEDILNTSLNKSLY